MFAPEYFLPERTPPFYVLYKQSSLGSFVSGIHTIILQNAFIVGMENFNLITRQTQRNF